MPDTSTEHEGQAGEAKMTHATCCRCGAVRRVEKLDPPDANYLDFTCKGGFDYCIGKVGAATEQREEKIDALRTALVEAVDEQAMAVDALRTWAATVERDIGDRPAFADTAKRMRELADRLERDLDKRRKVLEASR